MRSRRVFRLSWKAPRRDFPQMNVNPKNIKVSGLSRPCLLRLERFSTTLNRHYEKRSDEAIQ